MRDDLAADERASHEPGASELEVAGRGFHVDLAGSDLDVAREGDGLDVDLAGENAAEDASDFLVLGAGVEPGELDEKEPAAEDGREAQNGLVHILSAFDGLAGVAEIVHSASCLVDTTLDSPFPEHVEVGVERLAPEAVAHSFPS